MSCICQYLNAHLKAITLLMVVILLVSNGLFIWKSLYLNWSYVILTHVLVDSSGTVYKSAVDSIVESLSQAREFPHIGDAASRGVAIILFAKGDDQEAISVWKETNLSSTDMIGWAAYARQQHRYDEALLWCNRALALDDEQGEAWHQLGLTYQELGQIDQAIFAEYRAWDLGVRESIDPLTELLFRVGDPQASVAVFGQAIFRYPYDPKLLVQYGLVLYNSEDFSTAVVPILNAIVLDDNFMLAYARMGDLMMHEGRYREAFTWYAEAIERATPGNVGLIVLQANAARSADDLSTAIQLYQVAILQAPDYAWAFYEMAWAYKLNGQTKESIEAIDEALILSEPNPPVSYLLRAGQIYTWSDRTDKAINVYYRVLEIDPDNVMAHKSLTHLADK